MKYASILLTGLLAVSLQAADTDSLRAVRISYQQPTPPQPPEPTGSGVGDAIEDATIEDTMIEDTMIDETIDESTEHEIVHVDTPTSGCHSCGPAGCGFYGANHRHCPWLSRCNMPQHMPYVAQPATYYYLRPYNHFHIPLIQEEAQFHGATAKNPYDTDLFERVYADFEASAESLPTP